MHHSPSAGLASNEVTAVAQDETGYIWIGTNNGLQRFDGVRYKTFHSRQNDRTSIPNDVILQVLFDKRKNLWLVTADGKVGIFDTRHFTYHEISVKLKKESFLQHGKKLISDQDGNIILLFAGAGLVTWSEKEQEFSADHNFIPGTSERDVNDVVQQPGTKKYWISTHAGMIIYNSGTHKFSYTGHNTETEKFIDKLGTIPLPGNLLFDSYGRLWFDSWVGAGDLIYAYDTKNNEIAVEHFFKKLL
jgi:ligand-binding sensor domain-containing protein